VCEWVDPCVSARLLASTDTFLSGWAADHARTLMFRCESMPSDRSDSIQAPLWRYSLDSAGFCCQILRSCLVPGLERVWHDFGFRSRSLLTEYVLADPLFLLLSLLTCRDISSTIRVNSPSISSLPFSSASKSESL